MKSGWLNAHTLSLIQTNAYKPEGPSVNAMRDLRAVHMRGYACKKTYRVHREKSQKIKLWPPGIIENACMGVALCRGSIK